jgi:hypothetical protein
MPRRTAALLSLSATLFGSMLFGSAALADDIFTITGTDNSANYSLQFDLPSSIPNSAFQMGIYQTNLHILVDGTASETGTVDVIPDQTLLVYLNDLNSDAFTFSLATPYTTTNATATTFIVPSSIAAVSYVDCTSSRLVMPGRSALPTLALLQMPTFTTSCGDSATLSIGPLAATVTPEPPSITLLALGALGLVGIFGRALLGRFRFMAQG